MKYLISISFILISITIFSCDPSESDQDFKNQQLINEKLDSIRSITDQYDADSVYQKFKFLSQNYPQEFLNVNLDIMEIALEEATKSNKWYSMEEVQQIIQEFKEIEKGIKSAKSREEVRRLNERFDSLHMRYEELQKEHPDLHNLN